MHLIKAIFISLAALFCVSAQAEVNINTANEQQLMEEMRNIGPVKAAEIIRFRNEHGPFKSVDDLLEVKGIGPTTFRQNRDLLIVGGEAQGHDEMTGSDRAASALHDQLKGGLPATQ